jgi:hypothetical protein
MAVSALPHTRTRASIQAPAVSPAVLVVTLVAPALDLLAHVQPGAAAAVPVLAVLASATTSLLLLVTWAYHPRTGWLAAATLAASASLVLRLVGAEVAPALSLLALVGLGIGGAFAEPSGNAPAEAWLG